MEYKWILLLDILTVVQVMKSSEELSVLKVSGIETSMHDI